jgi:galactokinase
VSLRESVPQFAPGRPIFRAKSPGRLDLMGGNVDYTGGLVFQATIRESTSAAIQLRPDGQIVLINPQMEDHPYLEFHLVDLTSDEAVRALVTEARWSAYVLGVFHLLRQRYSITTGATVYIESTVPLNKGVSSSAAVEVAVMKAAAAAYGIAPARCSEPRLAGAVSPQVHREAPLAGIALAEACQWVENVIAQAPCGIMDQAAVVLGEQDHVLPLLCQPCCPYPLVRLPEGLECRAIDSGVRHSIAGLACETARAAAFMAYKLICDWENLPVTRDDSRFIPRFTDPRWNGYLSNLSPSLFRSRFETRLPEFLSGADYHSEHVDPFTPVRPEVIYPIRAAARYAVEEHQRVKLFTQLTDGELMGELMFQSHYAYTECGLGCAETDYIVDLIRSEGLLGAKMTGGGAGGTVAVLCRKGSDDAFTRVVEKYAQFSGTTPYVFEGNSPGADRNGIETL